MTTVLVIDDDPESRARVRKAAPADWQVLEAPDGIIGLDLARQNPGQIGLVVLDVELPEMEGRVVCLRLRDISPSVPILPYTGYEDTVHVLAEFACRRPVLKTDSDVELTQAMIAAVQEPPLPFAPSPTVRWMQATGQRFEDLVRKQRVGVRVAVYAASEYHRGALMHLLPVGIYGLDAAQLSAIETILHGMEILALVAHADDYAGVVPLATEYRVPLILVAADQAQALAVRVANVATVLLASDDQIEHHLARALEQLALGLPPEQPEFTAPRRQSTRHVVPAHFAQRLAHLKLRPRELDVVWLYYQGMSPEQAARVLKIEVSTVYTHWKNARLKLDVEREDVRAWVDRTLLDESESRSRP